MHQTGPSKQRTILQYVTFMLDVYQVCHSVSHCAKFWELFLIKSGVKLNEQHCWDILLSQQMLDAIKCVIDDNFVLQQDSALMHSTQSNCCSAKLSTSFLPITVQSLIPMTMRFRESYSSINMSCE